MVSQSFSKTIKILRVLSALGVFSCLFTYLQIFFIFNCTAYFFCGSCDLEKRNACFFFFKEEFVIESLGRPAIYGSTAVMQFVKGGIARLCK